MAQVYNEMRVLAYDETRGEMTVGWYDNTQTIPGTLDTPISEQNILQLGMKIPVEAEQNNWTRDQLRDYWLTLVEDVMDIPQWAKDEAESTILEFVPRVRILP